jgi:hypothetical protein
MGFFERECADVNLQALENPGVYNYSTAPEQDCNHLPRNNGQLDSFTPSKL